MQNLPSLLPLLKMQEPLPEYWEKTEDASNLTAKKKCSSHPAKRDVPFHFVPLQEVQSPSRKTICHSTLCHCKKCSFPFVPLQEVQFSLHITARSAVPIPQKKKMCCSASRYCMMCSFPFHVTAKDAVLSQVSPQDTRPLEKQEDASTLSAKALQSPCVPLHIPPRATARTAGLTPQKDVLFHFMSLQKKCSPPPATQCAVLLHVAAKECNPLIPGKAKGASPLPAKDAVPPQDEPWTSRRCFNLVCKRLQEPLPEYLEKLKTLHTCLLTMQYHPKTNLGKAKKTLHPCLLTIQYIPKTNSGQAKDASTLSARGCKSPSPSTWKS
ncbi:hypothetical protein EDB89DRAFT_1913849 [Lactarius sanguifluus]|nr:hypothetical protein EDB89DRAFT_1913849 [Lactarius sanguifluus]